MAQLGKCPWHEHEDLSLDQSLEWRGALVVQCCEGEREWADPCSPLSSKWVSSNFCERLSGKLRQQVTEGDTWHISGFHMHVNT